MIWIIILAVLWPVVGIVGGSLIWLSRWNMDLPDAVFMVLFGAVFGPLNPVVGFFVIVLPRFSGRPLIRRFGSRRAGK
jgi:hypothetical protein